VCVCWSCEHVGACGAVQACAYGTSTARDYQRALGPPPTDPVFHGEGARAGGGGGDCRRVNERLRAALYAEWLAKSPLERLGHRPRLLGAPSWGRRLGWGDWQPGNLLSEEPPCACGYLADLKVADLDQACGKKVRDLRLAPLISLYRQQGISRADDAENEGHGSRVGGAGLPPGVSFGVAEVALLDRLYEGTCLCMEVRDRELPAEAVRLCAGGGGGGGGVCVGW
jgi:hypothetical protein